METIELKARRFFKIHVPLLSGELLAPGFELLRVRDCFGLETVETVGGLCNALPATALDVVLTNTTLAGIGVMSVSV